MTKSRPKTIVVGAGFTGLVTAYALERAGYVVEVHERAEHEGGLLGTTETEYGLAESGANAFLNSSRVEALFADLGIPLVRTLPESRARFIFRGVPRRWPLGVTGTLGIFAFVFRFVVRRRGVAPRPGESLAVWGRRVMGEEATEYLLLPAVQGIYAGDGRRLSATLLLKPLFHPRPSRAKSVRRGSISAPGGMGEVVRKLRERLESRGVRFHFRSVGPSTLDHPTYFCGSASQAADYLSRIDPELSRLLGRIEMVPLVSLTGFFSPERRVRPGFGVLFPPREGFRSLGVLYNHAIFPGRVREPGTLSETWILGGARRPEIIGLDSDQILREILEDRKRLHALERASDAPIRHVLHCWPKAIPYYTVELEEVLAELSRRDFGSSRLRLMGNYLGGIGLTKILDRVMDEIEGMAAK